ncbi:MAG: SH3 domain-containing protein [Chloroflexota bacterium]|nr:SH3 domain-containing protein [Chloroflexota bacterium]
MGTASAGNKENRTLPALIITGLIVLLILAMVLPPVSLPSRIASAGMESISANTDSEVSNSDGTHVAFPAYGVAQDFRTKLTSIDRLKFLAGEAGEEARLAAEQLPGNLIPKSPLYSLESKGTAPLASVLTVGVPNDSLPYETLDLYSWADSQWQFIPSHVIPWQDDDKILAELNFVPSSFMVMQTEANPPRASSVLPAGKALPDKGRDALTDINPYGLFLEGDGTVRGDLSAEATVTGSYGVVPTVRNWADDGVVRTDLLDNLLLSPELQFNQEESIEGLLASGNYPGIEIDYRGLDPTLSGEFTGFIGRLADLLHENGKTLTLRVEPPRQIAENQWQTGGYDWRALGEVVDSFRIPAPIDPEAYAPGDQAEQLLDWAVGEVPRHKIELVLPARSVEQAGAYLLPMGYDEALTPLLGEGRSTKPVLVPGEPVDLTLFNDRVIGGLSYDDQNGMFTYSYRDDSGHMRTVWIENAASIAKKLELVGDYNLKGVVLEHLFEEGYDPDVWSVVREFLAGEMPERSSNYSVVWSITDPTGQVYSQERPLDAAGLTFVPPAAEGQVQVNASIADGGRLVAAGKSFELVMATATPEATATPLPTPTPAASPTPEPAKFASIVAQQTVNLRDGPSTAYKVVGQVKAGETLEVTGKNEDASWWQVAQSNGDPAWIVARLVNTRGPIDQVAVATDIPEPPKVASSSGGGGPSPAPSRASTGFFGYGIQAHMVDNSQASQVMNMTTGMGFNWAKQQVEWKRFEPDPGNYAWGALDPIVNAAGASGVSLLLSVVNAPRWARGGGADLSVGGPPEDPNTFANFLGALAGKYCGSSVKALEVWNEQNLHYEWGNMNIDPAAYMRLLKPSYNAIKQACPSMIVVSGAPTPTGAPAPWAMDDFAYLEGMYQNGLKNFSDAIGAHPSGYNVPPDIGSNEACATIQRTGNSFNGPCDAPHHSWSFRSTMEGYRNIMVKYGDGAKRIWPTEFGWAAGGAFDDRYAYANDNSYQEQAEWTVRAYQMMKNWGFVGPAFLWNLNFRVVANGTEKAQWGIVDPGWGALPAYSALQAMPK